MVANMTASTGEFCSTLPDVATPSTMRERNGAPLRVLEIHLSICRSECNRINSTACPTCSQAQRTLFHSNRTGQHGERPSRQRGALPASVGSHSKSNFPKFRRSVTNQSASAMPCMISSTGQLVSPLPDAATQRTAWKRNSALCCLPESHLSIYRSECNQTNATL